MKANIPIFVKVKLDSCLYSWIIALLTSTLIVGCNSGDSTDSNTNDEMQIVPRESAYIGSYPIIGTSQTGFWDGSGNSITAPAPDAAFYGQDAQFTHTTPVYTKSSDGLTVKDEISGLTWQKSYDSGTYYWAATQTVVDIIPKSQVIHK
jgi:hypothetical protein